MSDGSEGDSGDAGPTTTPTPTPTPAAAWRYCLHIAYLGTGFVGWQRQHETSKAGHGSIQELVEDAVTAVLAAPRRVNVTSVSRTDAGTHALYQYGTIRLEAELPMALDAFKDAVNARLPESVVVREVSRLDAAVARSRIRSRYKKYVYYIQQGWRPDLELGKFSWFIGKKVDPQRLRDALQFLVGSRDFKPFSQGLGKAAYADKSTVRTLLSAEVVVRRNVVFSLDPNECGSGEVVEPADVDDRYSTNDEDVVAVPSTDHKKRKVERSHSSQQQQPVYFLCVELIANGFLRHMVRRIIGTLRPIGEGTYPTTRIQEVLEGKVEPGPSAPTKGLWLHRTWLTQADWDAEHPASASSSA